MGDQAQLRSSWTCPAALKLIRNEISKSSQGHCHLPCLPSAQEPGQGSFGSTFFKDSGGTREIVGYRGNSRVYKQGD